MIGKTISHYKIIERIGEGGMGVVYRAEDSRLGRAVALKFLSPELIRDSEARERFWREAQAASSLDHPNICPVHEIDEAEGQTFIAMAHVAGESLEEKIEAGGALRVDEAVNIASQVAGGLQEAHDKGIVHRDIKSANIMVSERGHVRIMDFGLAKVGGRTRLTKTSTVMGTVSYMSPEQARGEPADHRTDIWSLGVVLFEMLTGRLPFVADSEAAVIHQIVYENPPDIRTLKPELPAGLCAVMDRAMQKNRDHRYQTATAFANDLANYQAIGPEQISFSTKGHPVDDNQVYKRVERRVRRKLLFYRHLTFFLGLNLLLFMINLLTGFGSAWFLFPFFALSVPLTLHAIFVFVVPKRHEVRERMIQSEIKKEMSKRR